MRDQPRLLTTEELAEMLRVSPGHIRNMSSQGKLPFRSVSFGRVRRYPLDEVKEWLDRAKG